MKNNNKTIIDNIDIKNAVTVDRKKRAYKTHPSIAKELPWREYDSKSRCFLLQDGTSVGAAYEIEDVACEAAPMEYLIELRNRFQGLFQDTIPQEINSPWHLQIYVQDELSLEKYIKSFKKYVKPELKDDPYTKEVIAMDEEHCKILARKEGVFRDNLVTGNLFQGNIRRIRLVLYRHITKETRLRRGQDVLDNINNVTKRIENQLKSADVIYRRIDGKCFYEWMRRWFNPNPNPNPMKGKITTDELLSRTPYPGDDRIPYGYDFAEQLFESAPETDHEKGVWFFDDHPHMLLTVQALRSIPKVGHITAERQQGKQRYGLFDRLPKGSIFVMNIVIEHQSDVISHIKDVYKSCAGNNVESVLARKDCQSALYQIEQGNYLFPTAMGVYVKGNDITILHEAIDEVDTTFSNSGFKMMDSEIELAPCDVYLRFLPMAYNYEYDKKKSIRRSRLIYARQIANMLPLYGRYRGSGRPCIKRWNRGGEPLCWDPYHRSDKSANSHILYMGETGAGKSATICYDMMSIIAYYNPRVFIIEAGDSFSLFCKHAEKYGKTVNQVKLSLSNPTPLNPFANAFQVLEIKENQLKETEEKLSNIIDNLRDDKEDKDDFDDVGDESRDLLGEMVLAAQVMITGGDPDEEKKFTRANRAIVLESIVDAARYVKEQGGEEVIAEDIVAALKRIAKRVTSEEKNPIKTARIFEMADSMGSFTADPFTAQFFNRPGHAWPECDITHLDMGLMKNKEYKSQLALAIMGMLSQIAHIAETTQGQSRMILVVMDELHVLTDNTLTMVRITQHSKMGRKLGMWLMLGTQNMADFPDEARKMLSMIEFWIGLGTSENEIDEMRRFKKISDKMKELFMSVSKNIPNYVEGIIMSRMINGLFRNVPPRLALALGMTEKDEKVERQKLINEHGTDELGAVNIMADQMKKAMMYEEHN